MYLDPRLLQSFLAVADSASFSRAAQHLNCTQSTVSAQIKRLEGQVGRPLFTRSTRRVALTEAGGALLPYARRMVHLREAAEIAVEQGSERPTIRLGVSEEQAERFLPRILPIFAERFPKSRIALTCQSSVGLLQRFAAGDLDVALAIRHEGHPPGEVLGLQPLVWVAGDGFALPDKGPLPLACHPEGCTYRAAAQEALSAAGRGWRIVCTSQSPIGVNAAVTAGLAVAVKAPRGVPEGARILTGAKRLPKLKPAAVELHQAEHALPVEAETLSALLSEEVRRELADTASP